MEKISVILENCYGIKKLSYDFDFSQRRVYAIYAPNGAMKSSFAATFKTISEGNQPSDRIFPKRITICKITDETGQPLAKESILVLPPYDEFFSHSEKTSTLLVNKKLKTEFELLHAGLNASKEMFLAAMKAQSKSKKPLDKEISLTFMKSVEDEAFYAALERVKTEVIEQADAPFAKIEYDEIFDEKVLSTLESKDVKTAINQYIVRYNALLSDSPYFRKGIFEYYNASQIAKALADHGFFSAKHNITLNGQEKIEISNETQLETLIERELSNITSDSELKKKFDAIKTKLEKNITLRDFQQYLCSHELLLPHLANIDLFKDKIWKSYFKANEAAFLDLLDHYTRVKARRKEIQEAARGETTHWEAAIDVFNERFFVPFRLEARNKMEVSLGRAPMLDLGYIFKDEGGSISVEKQALVKSLSQGEKKALYILNIIFEIEVRKQNGQKTLFVVDDIADSFDYKNKYAIIQYLAEISENPLFNQILLTHNFDFYRTVESRFVPRHGCLMAMKTKTEILLNPAYGIRNVFVKDWKGKFFEKGCKRIACIPFIRNLIEYTKGDTDPNFIKLTSLLHWKSDTQSITEAELDSIYNTVFEKSAKSFETPGAHVVDQIYSEADSCLKAQEGTNFENKIVLAIAIRLIAERYMIGKIANPTWVASIDSNQTPKLLKEFQKTNAHELHAIKTMNCVVLMTPENIHLNAFMYEPILDMSDDHLRKLYADVKALK